MIQSEAPLPPSPRDARLPLRLVLTLPFIALMIASAGLIGWFSLENGRLAVLEAVEHLRVDILARVREQLAGYLSVPPHVNEVNAQSLAAGLLDPDDPKSWRRYFHAVIKASPSIAYTFFGTPEGEFYGARRLADGELQLVRAGKETGGDSHNFSASPLGDPLELKNVYPKFDPRTRPWYKAGEAARGPAWTPLYRHFVIKDLALTAALPVYGPDGALRGVFGVDYVLNRIHDFLRTLDVGQNGQVFLLESSGELVASSTIPPGRLMTEKDGTFARVRAEEADDPLLAAAVRRLAAEPGGLPGIDGDRMLSFDLDGRRQFLQATRFADGRGLDWLIVVAAPESDFMGPIATARKRTWLLIALATVAVGLAGFVLASRVAAPIESLARAAEALSRGQWDRRLPVPRGLELARLARAFSTMRAQLKESFDRLTAQHAVIAEHNRTLEDRVARRTAELGMMHHRLRAIFDAIPGFIHVIDRDFRVVDVGDKLLAALGLPRELVLGQPCHLIFRGVEGVCGHCPLSDPGQRLQVQARPSTPEEEAFFGMPFMAYTAPVLGDDGDVWGYIECLMDIGALRATEDELLRAKDAAETANRAKTDFLARMSHDIRTPLNSIIGLTGITLETPLSQEQRDYLRTVSEAGRVLLSLVSDLLDFAKIEAHGMSLTEEDFSLPRLLSFTSRALRQQARDKGLALRVRLDKACPRHLRGDPGRVGQMLTNLIANAIKFTETGGVRILVEMAEDAPGEADASRVWIRFSVSDTGPGIPPEVVSTIFEPFRQADPEIARRYGGTGLGLAICRELARLMGGDIAVTSLPGQGSTFSFAIPLGLGDPDREEAASSPAVSLERLRQGQRPLRLLLAEDNPMNVTLAKALLSRLGHRTTVVGNGREAIEALAEGDFDAVLMDMEMPEMDGLTATRLIREGRAGGVARDIPILAMTAHALAEFKDRCLAAGVGAFIPKPINFAELAAILGAIAPRADERSEPDATPPPANGFGGRLDRNAALARLDGDLELFRELCDIFTAELPERLETLRQRALARDLNGIFHIAHLLKNSCGAIGAEESRRLAADLEAATGAGDVAMAIELARRFELALVQTAEAIRAPAGVL